MKKALDNKYAFAIINIVIYTVLIYFILPLARMFKPDLPVEAESDIILIILPILMIVFSMFLALICALSGNNNKKAK